MSGQSTIGIGLIGCGAVGSEVARILLQDRTDLAARTGVTLDLRHVLVRDKAKPRPVDLPDGLLCDAIGSLLDDARTGIIVELAGGEEDARRMTLAALEAGKSVVTANKALLASYGPELFLAARRAGRCIAFEAAVAGGIPLIESIRSGLVANRIDAIFGILNGTCNYILTKMLDDTASYAHALAQAQRLGYAEQDPTLDVDGTDSAHKLAVLTSIAMRQHCRPDQIRTRGISHIALTDLVAADELGYACKLLAIARRHDGELELGVQPTFIPKTHPLAAVGGPFNAVSVYGSNVGHTLFYGPGAGGRATASAVVADIIDVAIGNALRTFEHLTAIADQAQPAKIRPAGGNKSPFYVRVGLVDRPGGIGRIATLMGEQGISIATIVQHESAEERPSEVVPVVVTTHAVKESSVWQALSLMELLDIVVDRPVCIPLLNEHFD
ncbi:MAG: homoserine dehydrogenase [Planctomycetota bacterium]